MTPQENEALFQKALNNYRLLERKQDWDTIWLCVHLCCENLAKKKLVGVACPDFDDKVIEASLRVIKKINEGENPRKLSSFCYLYVIGVIYDRKTAREERNISYEQWQEYQYARENE